MGDTTTLDCPICGVELTAFLTARWNDEGHFVDLHITRLVGCPHADAWNRGPRGDGGEPLPLPRAA